MVEHSFGATPEQKYDRAVVLGNFGLGFIGTTVHHQMSGVDSRVVGYRLGVKMRGVWLITESGKEVYRQYRGR